MASTTQEPRTRHRLVRRRRRWPRRLLFTVIGLGLVFYGGGGWYFADQVRAEFLPNPHQRDYRATLTAVGDDTVTIGQGDPADGDLFNPGILGLVWEGGYGTVTEIIDRTDDSATRRFVFEAGDPPTEGILVDVDPWIYPDDFATSLGHVVEDVTYQSPLGEMSAVFVPGTLDTWVILVHGRNAAPRETMRIGTVLAAEGYPLLAITHRNDRDQPSDPSGFHQYGATEWEDVEAAVGYAVDQGAAQVVLVGFSTGAAHILSFLEKSPLADETEKVVLDSPNIDFGAAVTAGAIKRKLPIIGLPVPSSLAWAAKTLASIRFGIDWGELNYVSRAMELEVPILVLHGTEDPSIPIEISRRLGEARPDLVTVVEFEGGKHVQSWNIDPERYEKEVLAFLADK